MPGTQTKGYVHSCACPWCRKPNDFRDLDDYGLEPGNVLSCDHCKKNFKIKALRPVTVITLEQFQGRGNLYQ